MHWFWIICQAWRNNSSKALMNIVKNHIQRKEKEMNFHISEMIFFIILTTFNVQGLSTMSTLTCYIDTWLPVFLVFIIASLLDQSSVCWMKEVSYSYVRKFESVIKKEGIKLCLLKVMDGTMDRYFKQHEPVSWRHISYVSLFCGSLIGGGRTWK